jgi:Calcineurin-like phosphoesterase/Purple acid Phosphatase, N-terminal domain
MGKIGRVLLLAAMLVGVVAWGPAALAQITYKPYVQPGDNGAFGAKDQMVVAWQTSEASPNTSAYSVEFGKNVSYGRTVTPQARVVDNYLSVDPALAALVASTASGAHSNYSAVLGDLEYNTTYFYRVNGPGMPAGGFAASFHTRKRGDEFSFIVQGDEGFFPVVPEPAGAPPRIADYEARIVHLMYNVQNLSVPGAPKLPKADLALNTGDNVYTNGAEGSYRDYWFPVWNSDVDSNETGAPFIRSIPFYIVVGNHDIGATGVNVNMLGGDGAGRFTGNTDGGDALAYFNNYYFPLNGPIGVDPQFTYNGDASTANGMFFSFKGNNYNSPAAITAYKASTLTDSGKGAKQQIDHESNYSFDYGNAHYVFLDANPHLFDGVLDGPAITAAPQLTFPAYPSVLRDWLIHDLDSSSQPWKFVVFHQPAFSSGNATIRNNQMRAVAKFLEDHGVNMVFNGHEHNYQRTFPIRANANVAAGPSPSQPAAVSIDTSFDGVTQTVPDGVLYIVEGAGGNRDFDGDLNPARGSGLGIDQDDSATGLGTLSTFMFPNGPASWIDTHLTSVSMSPVFPDAGKGPKITARFKAKLFSFADLVVRDNKLTLYQISEPLLATSSATPMNPAPFGTDVNGNPVNDPIPDTLVDPATGNVVSPPAEGPSVLLDKFAVTKPDLEGQLRVSLQAPESAGSGGQFTYVFRAENGSAYSLNGTQAVFKLPGKVVFVASPDGSATQIGRTVVVTVGRLAAGASMDIRLTVSVGPGASKGDILNAKAELRSSTALAVEAEEIRTTVNDHSD